MANYFYRQVMKARQEIARNPRKCDLCGEIETVENVMLEYENGLVKKYYKAVGEYMAQNLSDACERAAIAFSSFSDALRKVFPDEVAEMEKADKTEE